MRVGFIGIGIMGVGMAGNILKAGHELIVYNRTREKARPLLDQGARFAETPRAAGDADVLFTMVSDDAAEEALAFGEGLVDSLPTSTVHVASSTIGVDTVKKLTEAHRARGRPFVCAPVLGRGDVAAAGRLVVMAAGPAAELSRLQPLFDAIGRRTFVLGEEPVMAAAVKLSANFMLGACCEALSEAYAMVTRYGIDRSDFFHFLTNTHFSGPVFEIYGKIIEEERYMPANFPPPLALKDQKLAWRAGEAVGLAMPIASLVRDRLVQAIGQGYGEYDWSVMAKVVDETAKPRT